MELSEILGVEAVRAPLKATSKKRLLQELADFAGETYGVPSETVYKALLDREALGPTGVGRGVAIPHARFSGVDRVLGLFVRLEKPVDFEAIDRQPVDLVFTLLAPESAGADHLKALARVSRTLRSETVCASCARPSIRRRSTPS
jgi:nitrogen PTS system EIIA component